MSTLLPRSTLPDIALAPNPNGGPPDFDHGPTLQPTILATGIVFIAISVVFVAIRLGTSLYNSRRLFLDDYLCLLGEAFGLAFWFVFYQGQVTRGMAKHSWDIQASAITPLVMKSESVVQITTGVAEPMVKCAILAFFLRLFGSLRWVRIFCHVCLVVIPCIYIAYVVGLLVYCIPRPGHAWDSALLLHCDETTPATIAIGVCNVVIDIAIFLMPFFIISRLNISRERRRALAAVFLVGLLTVVASIVGLVYRILVQEDSGDAIWNGMNIDIATAGEVFGTVIVSCTPSLWSFWFNIFIKTRLYSTLVSTIRSRSGTAQSSSFVRAPKNHHGGDSGTCHCNQCRPVKRLHTPTSSEEPVEQLPPRAAMIQKSTVITLKVSGEVSDTEMQQAQVWGNTSQEGWRVVRGAR